MTDNSYRLVLQCVMDDIDYNVEFDYVEGENITDSSNITEHPLVSGDTMADHMYRMPTTMNVDGEFSLYGNRPTMYVGDYNDRLSNIEAFFTKIKNEGIFCTLVKLSRGDNVSTRFIARNNMVLTSINWREKQSSVVFSFNFTEAITANIQTVDYAKDLVDPNLPAITDAALLDFTDTLLDWDEVDRIIYQILLNNDLITPEMSQYALEAAGSGALVGGGIALGAGIAVLVGVYTTCSAIPGVGWAALGLLTVGGLLAGAVYGAIQAIRKREIEQKYKVEQFHLYETDEQNRKEVERLCEYVGNIHLALETLEDKIKIYKIPSNEPQECMLYLDDNYYIFKFSKNNNTNFYSLDVTDVDGKHPTSGKNGVMNNLVGYTDIGECTNTNHLFRTAGRGSWVYVMNLTNRYAKDTHKTQKEIDEMNRDLTNYAILVSQVDLSKFTEMLTDVIDNAMTR